jgi:hypothetical protein
MRHTTCVLAILASLLATLAATLAAAQGGVGAAEGHQVSLETFEQGIGGWIAADDRVPTGGSKQCLIQVAAGGAPDGGRQSARIEFSAGRGWASVGMTVDGRRWATEGFSALALWIRGDGQGEPVRISLHVQRPDAEGDYWQLIKLAGSDWERYNLRYFGFTNGQGKALSAADVPYIRRLEFARSGSWKAFSFGVDEIALMSQAAAPAIAKPEPPPVRPVGRSVSAGPDFSQTGVPALGQFGLNLGHPPTIIDGDDRTAADWAQGYASDLGPTVVRLRLDDYFDARREKYDLDLLDKHLAWVAAANCKAMICVNPPTVRADDAAAKQRVFAQFVATVSDVARRGAQANARRYYEIFCEPLVSGTFRDVSHVAAAYNKIAELIAHEDPNAAIGGPGLAAAFDEQIRGFLKSAERLDFLSFHLYGTHNILTTTDELFNAAADMRAGDLPSQLTLQEVRRLARQLRPNRLPEIYVTEFGMSSARDAQGACRDERTPTAFGAAWVAAAALCGSPYVDKLLYYRLGPGGWGMVTDAGQPDPVAWAAWMLRSYAPRGAQWLQQVRPDDQTLVFAVKTKTAYNLIVAYGGADVLELKLSPRGLPPLSQVRDRRITAADSGWKGAMLPTSPIQTEFLDGAGLLVVQYVPQ